MRKLKPAALWLLEAVLLLIVLLSLIIWFNNAFKNPIETDNSAFQHSYWLGASVKQPTIDFAKIICETPHTSLSTASLDWCQKHYKADNQMMATIKSVVERPSMTDSHLRIEQDNQYKALHISFKALFTQNNNTEAVESNKIPTHITDWLKAQYGITNEGSATLYCSWWMLDHLEKQGVVNKSDISLMRAILLMGENNNDLLNMNLPNNWAFDSNDDINNNNIYCEKNGTPLVTFENTSKSIKELYQQKNNYIKTIQTVMLSKYGHWLFAMWAISAYIILCLILNKKNQHLTPYLFFAIWSTNLIITNHILTYDIISNTGFITLIIVTIISTIGIHFDKNHIQYKSKLLSLSIYPLFVFFMGVGFFIIIDWSINGYADKRFLAFYQARNILEAFIIVSFMPMLKSLIFAFFCWLFDKSVNRTTDMLAVKASIILTRIKIYISNKIEKLNLVELGIEDKLDRQKMRDKLKNLRKTKIYYAAPLVVIVFLIIVSMFLNIPQLTSEVTRLLFIIVVSYCILKSLSRNSKNLKLIAIIYLVGLLFTLIVQLLTNDFGPVTIITYSVVILLAAIITAHFSTHLNSRPTLLLILALTLSVIYGVYSGFITVSMLQDRPAARVASMQAPFASTDDQMALVTYFLASTPVNGYGLGGVPWIGDARGVPEQTHSDYMPMAMYGVFGAWKLSIFYMLYLGWLAFIVSAYKKLVIQDVAQTDKSNIFFGWVAVIWAVTIMVQLCLTLAGNFCITPLTGISLPLLSFGQVSLLINAAIVGLLLSKTEKTQ